MRAIRVSKRNSTYQILVALKQNRAKRNELHEVFVEGVAAIKSALAAGCSVRRLICELDRPLSGWATSLIASHADADVIALDGALFRELTDRNEPSELVATFARKHVRLDECEIGDADLVVVVDRPSNRGNLGSIIRSANAFGAGLVVALGHGVDPFDPAIIRASMGAIFHTTVCQVESPRALANWIAGRRAELPRLSVIGTDSNAEAALADYASIGGPIVVLMGNEAKGLSVELKRMVDAVVRIPMCGTVDSLNVACAASIVLYELSKARTKGGGRGVGADLPELTDQSSR